MDEPSSARSALLHAIEGRGSLHLSAHQLIPETDSSKKKKPQKKQTLRLTLKVKTDIPRRNVNRDDFFFYRKRNGTFL